jgi:hypothetical protein
VAWRTGCSPSNAATIAAVAQRVEQFPQCIAGGSAVVGSGRGDRRPRRRWIRWALRGGGRGVHREPVAHGDQTGTPTRSDAGAGTPTRHQQDHRWSGWGVHHLEDHPAETGRGAVAGCAGFAPGGVDRRVDTCARHPRRPGPLRRG